MTRPGTGKTLKKAFVDIYDYLGLVIASSAIWFAFCISILWFLKTSLPIPIAVRLIIPAAFYVFLIAPLTAGIHLAARKMAEKDDPSVWDLLNGARQFLKPSWALAAVQVLIVTVLAGNAWFYTVRPMPLKLAGVLFIYALLVWALSSIYHYPVLIAQNPGPVKIIKRGLLLFLDNVGFTAVVFLAIILLTCFSVVTLFGLPLLYAGMVAVIQTRALRALFVKYEILPPDTEPEPTDDAWKVPENV